MPRDNSFKELTVREAGRQGGLMVLTKYGHLHFSKIGKKGQESLRNQYPGMARVWGAKGGRPRKPNLDNMGGQEKKIK
jgi:hypothetical protein